MVFAIAAPLLIAAVGLSLYALRGTVTYFYTPAQLIAAHVPAGQTIRLGGLVKPGSKVLLPDGTARFVVMDKLKEINVVYRGTEALPGLFEEGKGAVCIGTTTKDGGMVATQVLARHDEKYIPKNVADELKRQGEWRPESGMTAPSGPEKPL
jgi:cytochrome c-type biogenesis protein CcmE